MAAPAAPPARIPTFPRYAARLAAVAAAAPVIDPIDPIAALVPQLAQYPCIAIPGIPCSESVLRLALAAGETLDANSMAHNAPPLFIQVGNLTVPQMVRRLQTLGLSFPIYILNVLPGAQNLFLPVEHTKRRKDNYAILYIPPIAGINAAAHWSFTRVAPEEFYDGLATVIFTSLPLTDRSDLVFWRCIVNASNLESFTLARNNGRACACSYLIECSHQKAFLRLHPQARRVYALGDRMVEGCSYAQVTQSEQIDGVQPIMAPRGVLKVVDPRGIEHSYPKMWGCHDMHRSYLQGFPKWDDPITRCMKRVIERRIPGVVGLLRTLTYYDRPVGVDDVVIRPFHFKIYTLGKRYPSPFMGIGYAGFATAISQAWKLYKHSTPPIPSPVNPGKFLSFHTFSFLSDKIQDVTSVVKGLLVSLITKIASFVKPSLHHSLLTELVSQQRKLIRSVVDYQSPKLISHSFASTYARPLLRIPMYVLVAYGVWQLVRHLVVLFTPYPSGFDLRFSNRAYGNVVGSRIADYSGLDEVNTRLATLEERTSQDVRDRLRRNLNQDRWNIALSPDEIDAWVETVITVPGETIFMIPPNQPGTCITCLRKVATYRGECKLCKKHRRKFAPEHLFGETIFVYIGKLGIWSRRFNLPVVEFKEGVEIVNTRTKKKLLTYQDVMKDLEKYPIERSCRGWNSGPAFEYYIPECFPLGYAVSIMAFMVRLGSKRQGNATRRPFDLLFLAIAPDVEQLQPQTFNEFLEHFSGEKRQKMIDAEESINQGNGPTVKTKGKSVCKMKGFTKAEKSVSHELNAYDGFVKKPTEKPRFICCPSPEFLAEVGRYTHPQLKWLARTYTHTDRMFYAGCATPDQMNDWLDMTIRELPDPFTIVDDITACDSNHSDHSFHFHRRVRRLQYPNMDPYIAKLFDAEENMSIRVGPYKCRVKDVNGSGVSDTSYKNSAPCLFIRVFAIAHAVFDLKGVSDSEALARFELIRRMIYTSASGDDGITRCPRIMYGTDLSTPAALARYEEWWDMCGFKVKVLTFPEHRWRMATYLAMRPVWGGVRYEWAPEPSRRLRSLFWQLDNNMHPTTWARGVARQAYQQGRHCPILSDICEWYLSITTGPTGEGTDKFYSPFNRYVTEGVRNERAYQEFSVDYNIPVADLYQFRQRLAAAGSPYINISSFVTRRIMQEES